MTLPKLSNTFNNTETTIEQKDSSNLIKLLNYELAVMNNINKKEENKTEEREIQETESVPVEEYNIADSVDYSTVGSNGKVCSVKVNNSSKYTLNETELSKELNIFKDRSNSKILIMHTHTSESYTSSSQYSYQQTGNFRTQDSNYNVVRVGRELKG